MSCCKLKAKNPNVVEFDGAGLSKLFSIEVRKFTVSTKISRIHLLVVPVIKFIVSCSEFVMIETKHLAYFVTPNRYKTLAILVKKKPVKYWGSTVGCTERTNCTKRTNLLYIL